jgi:hypothetical protein
MRWIDDGVVAGRVDDRFAAVASAFAASFGREPPLGEHGAQLAVTYQGRVVVDLWGGFEDEARASRLRSHALIGTFSAIKAMVALSIHLLVERGLVDLERPIADYWPAFASHGKEGITTRHVLTHVSGLQTVTADDFAIPLEGAAWQRAILDAAPHDPVGAVKSYHALSFGQILGTVIERVSGRSVRPARRRLPHRGVARDRSPARAAAATHRRRSRRAAGWARGWRPVSWAGRRLQRSRDAHQRVPLGRRLHDRPWPRADLRRARRRWFVRGRPDL